MCDSGWGVSPLCWGVLLCAFLTQDLAAALPRELPGPFSGADPDTYPSPKMRSWSKSMSQRERIVSRRGFIPLHRSGSAGESPAGTKRFAVPDTQRSAPRHLLRVLVVSASSSSATSSLPQACATCRPRSKLPSLIPAFHADIWDFSTGWVQQREQ